jgi:lipid-binding SYLF domain-containing protein
MRLCFKLASLLLVITVMYGCARPKGDTPQQKRDYVQQMKDNTLAELYAEKPFTRDLIKQSVGYGVFSNFNTQLLIVGSGNGYGVVTDNSNGDQIYMRVAEGAVGLGFALKDFREIIIFNNKEVFYQFVTEGWNYDAQGDAALKYGATGGATGGEVPLNSDVVVIQMTKDGIALKATVGASKYWVDGELNNP